MKKNPIIGIIGGRGALGSVLVREFEKLGDRVLVADRAGGAGTISTAKLLKDADVVIVSVPLLMTGKVLKQIVPKLRKNQLLVDVTSVKEMPVKIMLQSKAEVIGLHPMFGPVPSVAGLNCYACPARPGKLWPWLQAEMKKMQLHLIRTTPRKHDKLMATHQSLQHLLMLALGTFLDRRNIDIAQLHATTTPSMQLALLLTGRLLHADPDLYKGIEFLNPHSVSVVRDLRQVVDELAEIVETRDSNGFDRFIGHASAHFGDFASFAHAETNRMFGHAANALQPIVQFPAGKTANALAILGPATQTELAASTIVQQLGMSVAPCYATTIADIFDLVATGKAKYGIIPLENYQIGPVRETVKSLFAASGAIQIMSEISRPIAHALLGQHKLPARKISRIFAHPQAHAQCRHFLEKDYPAAEIVETAHTGESVARAAADETALAIGPAEAAANYELIILKKNIEDDPKNQTRFIIIGKKNTIWKYAHSRAHKTALGFHFKKDQSGSLARALTIFASHGVNLSRIESIPTERKLGDYFFFIEATGKSADLHFKKALAELGSIAHVALFGSYTVA